LLLDPHRVARCLPGAAITEQIDEKTWAGTITVKIGPVAASYKGKMRFERVDAGAREAEIVASGQDVRGKGGADMRMKSRLSGASSAETEVSAVSEVNVTGILAQLGRGMIQDVSDQMFVKFTDAMRAELETAATGNGPGMAASPATAAQAPASAGAPLEVVSFGAGVLRRAAGRRLRHPGFWIVAIAVILFLYWLLR
jgi:carbon monoxide dehydrogenase subunit G